MSRKTSIKIVRMTEKGLKRLQKYCLPKVKKKLISFLKQENNAMCPIRFNLIKAFTKFKVRCAHRGVRNVPYGLCFLCLKAPCVHSSTLASALSLPPHLRPTKPSSAWMYFRPGTQKNIILLHCLRCSLRWTFVTSLFLTTRKRNGNVKSSSQPWRNDNLAAKVNSFHIQTSQNENTLVKSTSK